MAVLNDFSCRPAIDEVIQLGSSCGIELRSLVTEERGPLKDFEKPAHLLFGIDISISDLGNLVDELLEIDAWELIHELLNMFDDLTKDVMIVKLCRIWCRDVFERHVSNE